MTMMMGIPAGAHYLIDVTDTESAALFGLPKEVQKLTKDVGWESDKTGGPSKVHQGGCKAASLGEH